jgi:putative membrane-bound dehydrogenase-like protein
MQQNYFANALPRALAVFMSFGPAIACSYAIDGPLAPEQSLQYLRTEPGLKVELVAAEPMVIDPVAVAWDEKGRMFVVEDRGYPIGPGKGKPPVGQVVMLESTKGDGKYDKRTVYADGLTFPNGVMPWKGGIYVTCAPYLYYFKDTKGDGKADVKEVVFKGFQDLSTTQLRVSHPTLNIDNWVYLTSGLTAAKVTAPAHPDRPVVFLNRVDGRFRPGTDQLEETAGTAQFGQTFDRFGRKFTCSNRNHIQHVVMQLADVKRNPNFSLSEFVEDIPDHGAACRVYPLSANITTAAAHTGYITSACGIMIFEGTALPDAYRGNSFMCEPAGNLVHRDVIAPDGVTFVAKRAFPTNEFLASPDNWFRPVNIANGPDGALYVCDMYRKTIEHPEYLPEAVRKVTDFESGKTMGRIYRIRRPETGDRRQETGIPSGKFDLGKLSSKELVAEFNNPNIWWRMTAQRLLLERQDKKAAPYLREMCKDGKTPEARIHALRMLEGLGVLSGEDIEHALADPHPAVREQGLQLALPSCSNRADLNPGGNEFVDRLFASGLKVATLADDPDPRVRFQSSLTLGNLKGGTPPLITESQIISALVKIATGDLDDKWSRAAVLSSINHREEQFLRQFLPVVARTRSESLPLMMQDLSRIVAAAAPLDRLAELLTEILRSTNPSDLPWQMAAAAGFGDGLRTREHSKGGTPNRSALMGLCSDNSTALREELELLFKHSGEIAISGKQPLGARLAAINLLGQSEYSSASPTLETLIEPQQPSEIQTAAIRALGRFSAQDTGVALVKRDRWNSYTPAVRDVALSALMSSTNSLQALFAAIEQGDVPAWTVNADRRSALMNHKDEAIRTRAKALFKDLSPGDRMKVYEECKSVLTLNPDPKNGHAVFQKNCTPCHVFAGEGKTVGPDLTGIRNQPSDVLLLHIVVPEYEIMPIYTCYNVDTKDGQTFTGIMAAETPSTITLRMAQGVEQKIPRSDIASMNTSRLSLMPQEFEKAMSRQDLADLIAFLKGQ